MSLLQAIDVGVIVLDREYKIQVWNSFMENHSGLRPENVRGKQLFSFFPEIPEQWFRQKVESVFMLQNRAFSTWEQRPYIFRFKNYRPITGLEEYMYQNISLIPLISLDTTVNYVCITIYDVTDVALSRKELETANKQLAQQSRTDRLTGLNNRGFWEDCLKHEYNRYMRYGNKCSMVMFDIDHFKEVNDTYGHQVGDEVLREVSKILKNNMRSTDIAGRYGGEEFGVILLDNSATDALVFSERLREAVQATTIKANGKNINITISLGIAEFSEDMDSHTQLIEKADKALYQSKNNGRNRLSIYPEPVQQEAVG